MLNTLHIAPTEESPVVVFEPTGRLQIGHRSLPEDPNACYAPALEWLEKYAENPAPETVFEFGLEYYNTASAKQLYKVLSLLEKAGEKSKVKILWFYMTGDEDMCFSGERFARLVELPFEVIEVDLLPTEAAGLHP